MADLFIACAGGLACLLVPFGFAFLAVRDAFTADEAQFLPSDDQEPTHAARPFGR